MKKRIKEYLFCTIGAVMFVFGVNAIISPLGLYNGGFVGMGQIARYLLEEYAGIKVTGIDIAGLVYFALNAPLFVLAFKSMSKEFFGKTVYTVVLQTILFSVIPIPEVGFTSDVLTSCIIGGFVSGIGVGIILRAGSSGGGQDILGVYFAKKYPGYSVGKMTLIINGFVYGCCALLFDMEIVVYSLIYTGIMSLVMDKVHIQNINTTVIIVTKKPGLEDYLIKEMNRGVTCWKGTGGYSKGETNVAMVALSKYEVAILKKKLYEFDKDAFYVLSTGNDVGGHFEKRLEA